jgi:hypothetical protein
MIMTAKNAKPRGRRRQTDVDPGPILRRIEREPLIVVEKGKRKRVCTLEALVRRQFAAAMKGNPRAVRRIIKWAKAYLKLPQEIGYEIIVVPDEYFAQRRNDDV